MKKDFDAAEVLEKLIKEYKIYGPKRLKTLKDMKTIKKKIKDSLIEPNKQAIVELYEKSISINNISKTLSLKYSYVNNVIRRFKVNSSKIFNSKRGRKKILDTSDIDSIKNIILNNGNIVHNSTNILNKFKSTSNKDSIKNLDTLRFTNI